jgi:DNA-binding response OmpR family regulator
MTFWRVPRRVQCLRMSPSILVVEDELLTRRLVQHLLESEGMVVITAGSVAEAMAEVNRRTFDLILLDILLPDGNGFEACRRIRERHRMPIVILSTRRQLEDRVAGLEIGADDYIVKPFEPREIVARVRAQLRRATQLSATDAEAVIRAGPLVVDAALQDAVVDGKNVGLTPKEYQLLHILAERAGKAVSRETLIEKLWGDDELASDKSVAVYIRRIRQKIERDPDQPQILLTVRGFGYRIAS